MTTTKAYFAEEGRDIPRKGVVIVFVWLFFTLFESSLSCFVCASISCSDFFSALFNCMMAWVNTIV